MYKIFSLFLILFCPMAVSSSLIEDYQIDNHGDIKLDKYPLSSANLNSVASLPSRRFSNLSSYYCAHSGMEQLHCINPRTVRFMCIGVFMGGACFICPSVMFGLVWFIISLRCKNAVEMANTYNGVICLWVDCKDTKWPGCIDVPCFLVETTQSRYIECGDMAQGGKNITAKEAYGLPLKIVHGGSESQYYEKPSCLFAPETYDFYKPYCTDKFQKKVFLQGQKQVVQKLIEQKVCSQRPQHYKQTITKPRQFRKK